MAQLESKALLKSLYTVFLGGLIALFVGLGIAAFYPQPKAPESPYMEKAIEGNLSDQQQAAEKEFQKKETAYRQEIGVYNRNVSVWSLSFAIVILVASLLIAGKIEIIPDGLLLGSVFTLIYSIGRGFGTDDARFRFVIVTVGLVVTMVIGYLKFLKEDKVGK